jgi:hypothetical protein
VPIDNPVPHRPLSAIQRHPGGRSLSPGKAALLKQAGA